MEQRRHNLEEYALLESRTHRRSSSLEQHMDGAHIPPFARSEHVKLASVAEKKRLWWRNAVINLLFIASWYVFAFNLCERLFMNGTWL